MELQFIDRSIKKGAIDAPVTSPYAWTMSSEWGPGAGGKDKKPVTQADAIRNFTAWVYICSSINASAVAAVPLRLYARKTYKNQKFKSIDTKPVSRERRNWLFDGSSSEIQEYLTKAVDVEEVLEHPFLKLMRRPNPFIPAFVVKETTVLFTDLTGDAYWYIVRNRRGVPQQIWVIPTQNLKPIPGETAND